MVERSRPDDVVVEEQDLARQNAERLRWINARIREASAADLMEEADDVDDEDDPPPSGER
ncbi:MAG: hypothetical protein IT340_09665 [Chloroflexi bacterium]|nr:hypothetical protein [Chloroflexota bacterium]